jgi:kumamolisin
LVLAGLAALPLSAGSATPAGMRVVRDTVRLPDPNGLSMGRAHIVRTALTSGELAAEFPISVTLRMRDFAALQALAASGARVSPAELEERFLPLRSDYDRVAAWLSAQGFTQTLQDSSHTTVFVRGTAAQVAGALGVRLARVSLSGAEYTSAVSEPSVPADLAGVVLSVNELQPQFRLRHVKAPALPAPNDVEAGGYVYVTPDNMVSAYNFPAYATGSGQIIAIVGEAPALASDLTTFWTTTSVAQKAANVVTINVDGGPPSSPSDSQKLETSLDVEWAGALAPAAGIRLYLAQRTLECLAQIWSDRPSFPSMSVVSFSYSNSEASDGASSLQAYAQQAAMFASAGISVLAASGDSGSNPSGMGGAGGYSTSAPLGVSYPASDPSVTGVGGTTITFTGKWVDSGEAAWNEISTTMSATGGGVSGFFAKPSYQTGGSVLAGQTRRCVPDVSAISNSNMTGVILGPGYQPFTGTAVGVLVCTGGKNTPAGGTSLACPVWAAVAAVINQARAAAGMGPVGLLNTFLYPLAGTGAFTDVMAGNNGAYSAGPGYDLCTGLGSPNVANLIAAIAGPAPPQRLVNISVRSQVETGANITIAGFVIQGPAGTTKTVLVRGVGPGLAAFGVDGALAGTVLGVYDSNAEIASNSGWGNDPVAGTSTVAAGYRRATAADMAAVGAFALAAGSADSAMVLTLPPGNYSAEISGAGNTTGVALSEVYETDSADPEVFANISSRCFVGTGSGVAISGFVISGSQTETLLIRGIGPALAGFGVGGSLAAPTLVLHDQDTGNVIASNTGWGTAPVAGTPLAGASIRQATAADMSSVGAFALTPGAADCAMVVSLPPGSYTAEVSGVGSTTGTALAEVYKMP